MGYPTLGGPVFVYPVHCENLLITKAIPLSVFECGELYLELVHSQASITTNVSSRISSETSYGLANGAVGSASPRTPMNQIKASSSVKRQLASPIGGTTVSTLPNSNGQSIDSSDITKLLGDDGSAKQLLDRCAAHWLYSRCLLRGNLVTIPVLSELCTFRVDGAKRLLKERAKYNLTYGSESDLPPEVSEPPKQFIDSFVVQRETKVCLALENPEKQGPARVHFDITDDKADIGEENSKLGGLSKEYGILQDIIVSLSTNFFSRYVIFLVWHLVISDFCRIQFVLKLLLLYFILFYHWGDYVVMVSGTRREFFFTARRALERLAWLNCVSVMPVSRFSPYVGPSL